MDRKIAKVRVSSDFLAMIMRADISLLNKRIETTAPPDLKVIGFAAIPDQFYDGYVYCESETFIPVPEGADVPEIPPFEYKFIDDKAD